MSISEDERYEQYAKALESSTVIPMQQLRGHSKNLYQYKTKMPVKHRKCLENYFERAGIAPGTHFLCAPGDNIAAFSYPVLCKSGPCEGGPVRSSAAKMCVILKLNTNRHWKPVEEVRQNDRAFKDKKPVALWRGSSTGWNRRPNQKYRSNRRDLVEKFGVTKIPGIDVAVVNWCQGVTPIVSAVPRMSIKEQLSCKYIIAAEGNDVASNLKWILASNSVPLMPAPTMRSWCLEDLLEPYVHYVPLAADFSDLEEKYKWCTTHEKECEIIANNGKLWIDQFMDKEREDRLQMRVIKKYFDMVQFCE